MLEDCKTAYAVARTAHWEVAKRVEHLRVALAGSVDLDAIVDTIYALKEVSKLCDDLRKDTNRLVEQLERQGATLWVQVGTGEPVRTAYCTGSPDVKQVPKTPKKGTPEYEAFCIHYGVDPNGMFSPDWNRMLEKLSADQAAGLPLPPGCDPSAMWTVCKVKIHKKRTVLDETEAVPVQDPEGLRHVAAVFAQLRKIDLATVVQLDEVIKEYDDALIAEEVEDEVEAESPF